MFPEPIPSKRAVVTALAAAYADCGYVQKKGHMSGGGASYSYAKESDFIEAVRPAFITHGLTIHPYCIHQVQHFQYTNKNGTTMNRVVGVFQFHIAHTSGEFLEVSALGEGVDSGDKAVYKAATGAFKYALRQSLMIETGDDPDASAPEPQAPARKPREFTPAQKEQAALKFLTQMGKQVDALTGTESHDLIRTNIVKIRDAAKYPACASTAADLLAVVGESL